MAYLHGNLEAGEEPKVTPATGLAGRVCQLPLTHPEPGGRTWRAAGQSGVASLLSEASKKVPQPLPVHASFSVAQ